MELHSLNFEISCSNVSSSTTWFCLKQTKKKMHKPKVKHHICFSTSLLNRLLIKTISIHTSQYQIVLMHCQVISIKTRVKDFRKIQAAFVAQIRLASHSTWISRINIPKNPEEALSRLQWLTGRKNNQLLTFHLGASVSRCRTKLFLYRTHVDSW